MKGPAGPFSLACPAASAILADLVLERVDDLYAAVLERNRDEIVNTFLGAADARLLQRMM